MDFSWLVVAVFGWPAMSLSFALAVVALVSRRPGLLFAAAVVGIPFGLYLSANPRFQVAGPLAVFAFLLSPLALRRQHVLVAVALASPFFTMACWLFIKVVHLS